LYYFNRCYDWISINIVSSHLCVFLNIAKDFPYFITVNVIKVPTCLSVYEHCISCKRETRGYIVESWLFLFAVLHLLLLVLTHVHMCVVHAACRPVRCRMYCRFGWAKDSITGCDICACYNPCNV